MIVMLCNPGASRKPALHRRSADCDRPQALHGEEVGGSAPKATQLNFLKRPVWTVCALLYDSISLFEHNEL
jgi:hypothetical protein